MDRKRRKNRTRDSAEAGLVRFGISIPEDLLRKFDELLGERNNQNRSEAIRDLIRERLVQDAWAAGKGEQVATLTLLYEHQNADVQRRLADTRRALGTLFLSAQHMRVSAQHELAIVVLRGSADGIRGQAEAVLGIKGVLHGKMVMTSAS